MGVSGISKNQTRRKIIHVSTQINLINDINSKYIIQKIFDNLIKLKTLEIIKYNKKIQNRLNLNINYYKEYSGLNTPIEIEIIPVDSNYDTFINIPKEDELYYHIYFNDKDEIKRNKIKKKDNDNKIKIIIDKQVKSFYKLFENCYIKYINFKKFYRYNIINMSYMFDGCSSLEELNLPYFNTNNVNNMSCMFLGCSTLKELNLSNFNTNNVTDMSCMFLGCSSLKELNLSNFNTKNVTNMSSMFSGCSSLQELNLSIFNTNNVTNMFGMFSGCSSLKHLNISNFNTNNVTDMSCMFYQCSSLKELNLANFNTNNVTDMSRMFFGCPDELQKKYKSLNEEYKR